MKPYKQDIFYDISKLDNDTRLKIFDEAREKSYRCVVHVLKHLFRELADISYEEAIEIYKKSTFQYPVFIHRRGFNEEKNYYLECGFRCGTFKDFVNIDYFLFINCNEEVMNDLIEKYKLEKMN